LPQRDGEGRPRPQVDLNAPHICATTHAHIQPTPTSKVQKPPTARGWDRGETTHAPASVRS
jgi:hypothetical protein